jgi:hypothetical protein
LHLFKSDASFRRTFFGGSGFKYHGLAYDDLYGFLITSEKVEGTGVFLNFLNIYDPPHVVQRTILLTPTW